MPLFFVLQPLGMWSIPIPSIKLSDSTPAGRWKLWLLASLMTLAAAVGTWGSGQYQIGRLDNLKGRYETPVEDFAVVMAKALPDSMEADLLEGCKQVQIGTWLQTTDALKFNDPISGNRIHVELAPDQAFLDINGREISSCVSDEVENRQFDIGSMTNTWAIILLMVSLSFGAWAWICFGASKAKARRNIYAETLADPDQMTRGEDTPSHDEKTNP